MAEDAKPKKKAKTKAPTKASPKAPAKTKPAAKAKAKAKPDIKPGSKLQIKVVARPTNAAALKTLVRILSKDDAAALENRKLAKIRKKLYSPRRRGGRLYSGHMPKLRRVKGEIGETGTVMATMDVIRDLGSIARFVEIS